jgi:hypothetical protein
MVVSKAFVTMVINATDFYLFQGGNIQSFKNSFYLLNFSLLNFAATR